MLVVAKPWVSRVWNGVRERVVRRSWVVCVLHHGPLHPWCGVIVWTGTGVMPVSGCDVGVVWCVFLVFCFRHGRQRDVLCPGGRHLRIVLSGVCLDDHHAVFFQHRPRCWPGWPPVLDASLCQSSLEELCLREELIGQVVGHGGQKEVCARELGVGA